MQGAQPGALSQTAEERPQDDLDSHQSQGRQEGIDDERLVPVAPPGEQRSCAQQYNANERGEAVQVIEHGALTRRRGYAAEARGPIRAGTARGSYTQHTTANNHKENQDGCGKQKVAKTAR